MKRGVVGQVYGYWIPLYALIAVYSVLSLFCYEIPADPFGTSLIVIKSAHAVLYVLAIMFNLKEDLRYSRWFVKLLMATHVVVYPIIVYLMVIDSVALSTFVASGMSFLLILALLDFRRKQLGDLFATVGSEDDYA